MNGKIRIAVIGCGNIGKRHIAVIDAEERAELVAICDVEEELCKEQSMLYSHVPYFTDYQQLLAQADAQLIHIATPHALHAEMALQAIQAGKHVLVEKPFALDAADCERMIVAAKQQRVKLYVVKQNRYNVPVRLTQEALSSGKLGKVFMVKCDVLWNRYEDYYAKSDWRGDKATEGGALFTQASHFIDLLVWWFGDVVEASGSIETKNHQIEIEDCGIASLKFDSGVLGALTWTTCVYNKNYEGSITIIGEHGTIKIGGKYLNKIEYWDVKSFPLQEGIDYTDMPNLYGKYQGTSSNHDKMLAAIIENLDRGNDSVVEGEEGVRSISAIQKIYASVAEQKAS